MRALLELVGRHRAGEPVGLYSVCSAHPLVLEAALTEALATVGHALIEATSNQVNQDGGYTGLRPAAFREQVWRLADGVGLARERVLLGGDHLGPNCWQQRPAADALARAGIMVAEYVQAGFRKIHLDCSMACGDDPRSLGDERIASRTAALCARAEEAWRAAGGEPPVYVIGSEVPVPGGAHETLQELAVTEPAAALATVDAHRAAFLKAGLAAAWERVIGLVVQPGVEFDNEHVVDYVPAKAAALRATLDAVPRLVFEAHSTDYQTTASLAALVRDHFAILKVGPGVTFALREAIWALDRIEREWLGDEHSSGARAAVLAAMHADPTHWRRYYAGAGRALELQLEYGLSDRIRYYWPERPVAAAVERLYASLDARPPPAALVSQYLPAAYRALRARAARPRTRDLVVAHVREVLAGYARACTPGGGGSR
jgi:D-tagatose-1,6-bisphosphate aldolase subunit GatZ/KbaZ